MDPRKLRLLGRISRQEPTGLKYANTALYLLADVQNNAERRSLIENTSPLVPEEPRQFLLNCGSIVAQWQGIGFLVAEKYRVPGIYHFNGLLNYYINKIPLTQAIEQASAYVRTRRPPGERHLPREKIPREKLSDVLETFCDQFTPVVMWKLREKYWDTTPNGLVLPSTAADRALLSSDFEEMRKCFLAVSKVVTLGFPNTVRSLDGHLPEPPQGQKFRDNYNQGVVAMGQHGIVSDENTECGFCGKFKDMFELINTSGSSTLT